MMTDFWSDTPQPEPHRPESDPAPQSQIFVQQRARGRAGTSIVIAFIVLALLAAGGYYFYSTQQSQHSDVTSAEPTSIETSSESPVTQTVTITASPPQEERIERSEVERNPRHDVSTASVCDGRGVLIVNSIYGDSPTFNEEVAQTRSQYPGVEILAPGTCPSLRARHNGSLVYAAVIDYGHDIAALCAAEVPGVLNARLLNNDSSYSSPC